MFNFSFTPTVHIQLIFFILSLFPTYLDLMGRHKLFEVHCPTVFMICRSNRYPWLSYLIFSIQMGHAVMFLLFLFVNKQYLPCLHDLRWLRKTYLTVPCPTFLLQKIMQMSFKPGSCLQETDDSRRDKCTNICNTSRMPRIAHETHSGAGQPVTTLSACVLELTYSGVSPVKGIEHICWHFSTF
jgi:hypothetical protein